MKLSVLLAVFPLSEMSKAALPAMCTVRLPSFGGKMFAVYVRCPANPPVNRV